MELFMFEEIGVSERTRKPWTVAVSFAGQGVMIGLAILVPLVSTEALPHGRLVEYLTAPGPPPPPPSRVAPPVSTRKTPSAFDPRGLRAPSVIPDKVATVVDPPRLASAALNPGPGVPGGLGPAAGQSRFPLNLAHMLPAPEPPPPPPAKAGPKPVTRIYRGGLVQQGKLIFGPRPAYPPLARQARISGVVRLQAVIARDGAIMDLRVVSGHPLLVPAALAAVKQWIFQPTLLNGEPVEVATEIAVNFTLQ
jgi:periplasmic protein TonB